MNREEFKMLKSTMGTKLPYKHLQLNTQQLFMARYFKLNNIKRCFAKHSTGSGKTITALYSASENNQLYKLLGEGRIIIITFQKKVFMTELIERPELGYITEHEYNKLKKLEENMHTTIGNESYNKYLTYLKRKLTNLDFNGYIKFLGYQELHNMLYDEEGKVIQSVVDLFANSFIICDEIHNVYNSVETNSYGVALKYIFEYYEGREDEPKILLMSATPLNNKPSEIIDLLNILLPKKDRGGRDLVKSTFFTETEKLIPSAVDKLKNLCTGYFSFYINEDLSFMPKRNIIGENYGGLNFIKCDISPEHKKLLKGKKLALDEHNLLDAIIPYEKDFLYKTHDFTLIQNADPNWKNKIGIEYNDGLSGAFLRHENLKKYSGKYYNMLTDIFNMLKTPAINGKTIIYHDFVAGTGIKFIEQILLSNGIIGQTGLITGNTLCSICGKIYSEHTYKSIKENIEIKSGEHIFEPARYLIVYGELSKSTTSGILDLFNSPSNKFGNKFKFLLGSEMIREGYNFNCIRNMYIMHILPHISALIQLFGRAIRVMSNALLPPEMNSVNIKLFAIEHEIELYKKKLENYKTIQFIEKLINEYAVDVHYYYNIIKKSFISPFFGKNSEKNSGKNSEKNSGKNSEKNSEIGILAFPEHIKKHEKIKLSTYNVFYGEWEIQEIKNIITGLFIESPAWTYGDLWSAVKNPPYMRSVDTTLFKESNFKIALGDLIYGLQPAIILKDGIKYKILPAYNKETYYIIYPLIEQVELPIGRKLENMHGVAYNNFISWIQPENKNIFVKHNITNDLVRLNTNYDEMKYKFYLKFRDANILEIPKSTEVYGLDFHVKLLEECIIYVYTILTTHGTKSEYHEFYFKMLHFYNKIDLVIYANMLPSNYAKNYEDIITGETNTNTLLVSNISNITSSLSSFEITEIDKFISSKKITKVASNILPVGHLLTENSDPKLFTAQGWYFAKEHFLEKEKIKENDIIVGYYDRAENSISFKFKLRNPRHKIDYKIDRRVNEKGMVCETRKKENLEEIAKALGITITGTNFVICDKIKEYLLYMELKDRNKYKKGQIPTRTRWCYLQYENPDA